MQQYITLAQPVLEIDPGRENYSMDGYLSLYEDTTASLGIADMLTEEYNSRFRHHDDPRINFGLTNSAFWVRFVVARKTSDTLTFINSDLSKNLILVKNEPLLEDIRFYKLNRNYAPNFYDEIQAGSSYQVKDKALESYDFISNFETSIQKQDTFYLRIATKSQLIISFDVLTVNGFHKRSNSIFLFHGLLFGIFLMLIIYNLLLYYSLREKVSLFYSLYVFSFLLMFLTYQGYNFIYLGRLFDRDYYILPVFSVAFGGVTWLFLTREFLSLENKIPRIYKIIPYLATLAPLFFIVGFGFYIPELNALVTLIVMFYYIFGFIISLMVLNSGFKISYFYLIALFGMSIGIIITGAARNNLFSIPYNFWTQNALHVGVLWEAVVLAATVGYRFNSLKLEKEIEKNLIRNKISADLHDEIGSNLSIIALHGNILAKAVDIKNSYMNHVKDIVSVSQQTNDLIRDIAWFINPSHDNTDDLILRMKEQTSKMLINVNYDFSIANENEHEFEIFADLNVRRQLYLIYKELLNNIVKHSDAVNVKITITSDNHFFILIVQDDGKGYLLDGSTNSGQGLENMKMRAESIHAELSVLTAPNLGSKITLKIPTVNQSEL